MSNIEVAMQPVAHYSEHDPPRQSEEGNIGCYPTPQNRKKKFANTN